MKSFLLNSVLPTLVLALAVSTVAIAQPGSGGPGGGAGAVPVPLDGGVSMLLAGGVAYGIKHLRNRRRKA